MSSRFGILDVLNENKLGTCSETEVNIKLSDIYDLVETLRCTVLSMKKSNDIDTINQDINRLEELYRELTGLSLNYGFWER